MWIRRLAPCFFAFLIACCHIGGVSAQPAYFVDGYHGGIYGHYPANFTRFIVDSLRTNPDWKINLEIEPETWDFVSTNTPETFQEFKDFSQDQSAGGRVEFINPAYAQSYLWDISGECIIQQLARGMSKIREHFPNAVFSTYSSEEPCFTSALPGILNSFGFKYAVLKNPDTCWGGYASPHAGELVNWIGADGTSILAVPRYDVESLQPGSTWQTIANANSPDFVKAALAAHINHPVGMCLQDAGWRNGPWLENVGDFYQPSVSSTWRNYFERVVSREGVADWRFSQEDVQVSLVWGAQVLQRIAQEVRRAENRIVTAEKMATLANVYRKEPWPGSTLDEGWRTLMLSQHHDCWIVPFNGSPKGTWADKVVRWTANTCQRSDDVIDHSANVLAGKQTNDDASYIRVFNTLANARTNLTTVTLPAGWQHDAVKITDSSGMEVPVQPGSEGADVQTISFKASTPSMGFNIYRMEKIAQRKPSHVVAPMITNGLFAIETDMYKLTFDCARGGTIQSLIAKNLDGREMVDTANPRRFNEIRGYFYDDGRFFSTADKPAKAELIAMGPLRTQVQITGEIDSNTVTQTITLVQGEPRIDFSVRIDWHGSPGIGEGYSQHGGFRSEDDHKAFYNDRYKLLATFPINLPRQQIFKDAPFDVTVSRLTDTFFENWSAIKNNVILHWVDAYDKVQDVGLTLMTDHTSSYTHDTNNTLGLTLQYAGVGLWGRDYTIQGPTEVHYALLPHAKNWDRAGVWNAAASWNEPLVSKMFASEQHASNTSESLLQIEGDGWEVPTVRLRDDKLFVRLFNPSAADSKKVLHYNGPVSKIELMQLNDQILQKIPFKRQYGAAVFKMTLPRFGIGTLRITP